MFKCPVCNQSYPKDPPPTCTVCGWDLKINDLESSLSLEEDQKQLNWAKQTWKQVQHLKKTRLSPKSNLQVDDLLPRIEALEAQLKQASQERQYLQNLLEWVLHYLELINPEEVANTLTKANHWFEQSVQEVNPLSEVGMDYHSLIEVLAIGDWKTANDYTWEIILYLAGRQEEKWLRLEDIKNLPCTDLKTIDWLWQYYSQGLFSLTTQQQILDEVGGDYSKFCDQVGWRKGEVWLYYEELNFTLNAPPGHLPVLAWRKRACYGVGIETASDSLGLFLSRLLTCES